MKKLIDILYEIIIKRKPSIKVVGNKGILNIDNESFIGFISYYKEGEGLDVVNFRKYKNEEANTLTFVETLSRKENLLTQYLDKFGVKYEKRRSIIRIPNFKEQMNVLS